MKLSTIFAIVAVAAVSNLAMVDAKPALRRRAIDQTKEDCLKAIAAIKAANKGEYKAIRNVKAAVQNAGAAGQQMANGGAKIAGAGTQQGGKTVADSPKRVYQLIKQLEKKGPIATILKIIFGPPPKSKQGKKKPGKKKPGRKSKSSSA